MSEPATSGLIAHRFKDHAGPCEVMLPFALEDLALAYDRLTTKLSRAPVPEAFSRDEWGYLLSFMRGSRLRDVFAQNFGPRPEPHEQEPHGLPARLILPRSDIAIWLPNNVSLLGPLTVILSLATGARVHAKAGSGSENLTAALRDKILSSHPDLLLEWMWSEQLTTESFDRRDPRNRSWSERAQARIFFGGDAAAAAVEALPHRLGTPFFAFRDHSSLVWADPAALQDDAELLTLWRVFQVYGKVGCTSPQRVVLIGGSLTEAISLARRLKAVVDAAPGVLPPVHIASDSVMSEQVARANGWHTERTALSDAVFMAGENWEQSLPGLMGMQILALPLDVTLAMLPENIQTIGYIASKPVVAQWTRALLGIPALRVVPVRNMHHFGPFWDGQAFWRGLFREIEIRS